MSGVPAPVQEYCRQRVREQSQDAKCWECLRLSERASCDSFGLKCCRNAFVAMGLEREYAREGKGMFVGLSDRQGMKTCQDSLPIPVE